VAIGSSCEVRFQPIFATYTIYFTGSTGVDLFFVLSGYLIYGALIKKDVDLKSFYRKRINRIYPTFTFVFILYIFLSYFFQSENKIPNNGIYGASIYILQNFFLLPGIFNIKPIITVAWSLSYEIFYYLIIPILIMSLKLRSWRPTNRIFIFLVLTSSYLFLCEIGVLSRERILMFISGVILYEFVVVFEFLKKPFRFSSMLSLTVFLFAIISFGELTSDRYSFFFDTNFNSNTLAISILFFSFMFFVMIGLRETKLSTFLSYCPLRYLGNMSYSYYLIHGLTIKFTGLVLSYALHNHVLTGTELWLLSPIVFFLTLVSATILFVLVEKPFSVNNKSIKIPFLRVRQTCQFLE